jgi:phosphoribosylformylglycinamidine synthase
VVSRCEVGDIHTIAISHGEGRFVASDDMLQRLAATGQIATQYVDAQGLPSMDLDVNPNGSLLAIEGISSPDGRVLGKMGPQNAGAVAFMQTSLATRINHLFEVALPISQISFRRLHRR